MTAASMRAGWPLAFLLIGSLSAVTVRQASFAASYTDAAGYLNQARGFPGGAHWRPVPVALWAFWRYHTESTTSLAARSDIVLGTEVGVFPLGNPVLIASFLQLGGALAGFLVAPVCLAILMACAFTAAHRLAGARAGIVAVLVLAMSPSLVAAAVHPMSDVPTAAFWALALVMAIRGTPSSALAAGASVAMAAMIRPHLALLAFVPAYCILIPARRGAWRKPAQWRWRDALAFAGMAAMGPALVAWSQAALYGSPFTPGYPGPWTIFGREHVPVNLRMYPRLLVEEHSPAMLLGLAAAPWWRRLARAADEDPVRARLVGGAVAIVALNFSAYLFFIPIDHWGYLRYMSPALFALAVLFGASVVWMGDRLSEGNPRFVAHVVTVVVAAVPLVAGYAHTRDVLLDSPSDRRQMAFGHYLDAALPPKALVVTLFHTASVVYYTGKPIVRYDYLDPADLDTVVQTIERHGYVPYLLLEERFDAGVFRERFKTSRFEALDWPPRAVSSDALPITLRAFRDRAAYAAGARWPVDVVSHLR